MGQDGPRLPSGLRSKIMLYICTLDEIKANLGVDDAQDDEHLTRRMEALQGRFENHCNRDFLLADGVTMYFNGGDTALYVQRFPIVSITSIAIDGDQDWENNLLDSDGYRPELGIGKIWYGHGSSRWPGGIQNIRTIHRGGYVAAGSTPGTGETAMPEGLRRAFFMQIEFEWRNKESLGVNQVSAQGVSVQQGAQVSLALKNRTFVPEVETSLQPYIRYV